MVAHLVSGTTSGVAVPDLPSGTPLSGDPYPWIINPAFDLIFVAGGGAAVLVLINLLSFGIQLPVCNLKDMTTVSTWLYLAAFVGMHIFSDSHIVAMHMRIWSNAKERRRFSFYRTWLVLASAGLFCAGLTAPGIVGFLVLIFFVTRFWHWSTQAFGIALIYCQKRGYSMTRIERNIFRYFILTMAVYFGVRMLTFPDRYYPADFTGVPLPRFPPLPEIVHDIARGTVVLLAILFVALILKKLLCEKRLIPLPAMMLVLFVSCFGLAENSGFNLLWFYGPGFFHGSQYMAVTLSYHLKDRGLPEGMSTWDISKLVFGPPGFKYFGTAFLGGMFLYAWLPTAFSQIGYDRILIAGLLLSVLNFHHFITDAAIWRMRDPRCRRLLVS